MKLVADSGLWTTGPLVAPSPLVAVLEAPSGGLPPGDIAIMYLASLDPGRAIGAIERRLASLDEHIAELEATPKHPNVIGVDLAIERRLVLLRADRDWFRGLTARLRSGSLNSIGVLTASS